MMLSQRIFYLLAAWQLAGFAWRPLAAWWREYRLQRFALGHIEALPAPVVLAEVIPDWGNKRFLRRAGGRR